jgi:hypothetical protein
MESKNLVLRTIYIDPDVDDQLRREAFDKRTSKNDLLRTYLRLGMETARNATAAEMSPHMAQRNMAGAAAGTEANAKAGYPASGAAWSASGAAYSAASAAANVAGNVAGKARTFVDPFAEFAGTQGMGE